jgi:tetratricopeptide (TPR) repeat protein
MPRIGGIYFAEGDWSQARAYYARSLQVREPGIHSWWTILPLIKLGELAACEGKWSEAEQLLDEAMLLARENQDGISLHEVHDVLIERDLLQGRPEEALARHQRLMDDPQQRQKLTYPLPQLTNLYLSLGDVDRADELVQAAIEYWGEQGTNQNLWLWIALRGRVLAAWGKWAEAETAFLEAVARALRTRNVLHEAQALQWHGEMLAAHGETERARARLQEARAIYSRVGAAPYIAQIDEALPALDASRSRT